MRNRILAGLGVAALAAVGVAAPANAISDTSADLYVVHAVPNLPVDVFVNGELTLDAFQSGTSAGPLDLPEGEYLVEVFADSDATERPAGDPAITNTFTLEPNMSYTVVAHPGNAAGEGAALTAFVNDVSEIPAGQGKVTVRHTAAAPAVKVNTGSAQLNEAPLELGDELVLGPLAAGTIADVNVTVAEGGARAIELGDVELPAGTNIFVHAYGPEGEGEAATYDAVIFTIDDLHSAPAGVPAGEAGLGQQWNGGLIALGAALMLALAGAAVVVRRQTVGAQR